MERIEENLSPERVEKQKRWDEIVATVEQIKDRLGMPIDAGIKETVVALKAMEINPTQSCEGHLEHGIAAPWVDIADKEAMAMGEKINWREKPADEKAEQERKLMLQEIEKRNLALRSKIMRHLGIFYETRNTTFDRQLTMQGRGRGAARLESQGSALQKIANEETKMKKLEEYQEEMRTFTEFLKSEFFKEK